MKLVPVHNKLWITMIKIKVSKNFKRTENVIEMLIDEYNKYNKKKILVEE